jgi:pyruvate/2-oxoacid:ferredoxin oxidoreductase beta subunit/Pyruvate/2-oxoacid:ferredoxin oxidoreductase gamma subunit
MSETVGPLPFCPGCGHGFLTRALDQALVKLQPDPAKVVIVTDIGCIGMSDRHFITHAFHGLHGRALTYASGLKLARPDLTVIALQGDGGVGIGAAHLLSAARRNVGITLLIGNNFNFGMTGGQHSVTTPAGGRTATTPGGNPETPLDICAAAVAAGAPWVARSTVYEKDLPDMIARAITHDGFAVLDVWELCTAHYSPRNMLKKKDLYAIMESQGMRVGLFAEKPRPELGSVFREAAITARGAAQSPRAIEPKYAHAVPGQTGILIAGSAGQRVKSAATLFARAAILSGLHATQKDDYPITVMTGHSLAEVILSPETIDYTAIDSPEYVLVISPEGLARTKSRIEKLGGNSLVIAEDALDLPKTSARVVKLPLQTAARSAGAGSLTLVALGAFLARTDLFPIEAFRDTVSELQREEFREAGLRAIETGMKLMEDGDSTANRD